MMRSWRAPTLTSPMMIRLNKDYISYIGIMEKKMETTIVYWGVLLG